MATNVQEAREVNHGSSTIVQTLDETDEGATRPVSQIIC